MKTLLRHLITSLTTILISIHAFAVNNSDTLKNDPTNPIRLFTIFHDDIPESKRRRIYGEYIYPFTQEFESITGRKINVVFDENKPPYSNFNYKNEDHTKVITEWKTLAWQYRKNRHENNEFRMSSNDRVLLITNDMINGSGLFGGVGGVADSEPGKVAIASLVFNQAIGHELGHTYNAIHDEGEVLYDGWWCETFMKPMFALRSNCFVFSDANRKRIKDYVDSLY